MGFYLLVGYLSRVEGRTWLLAIATSCTSSGLWLSTAWCGLMPSLTTGPKWCLAGTLWINCTKGIQAWLGHVQLATKKKACKLTQRQNKWQKASGESVPSEAPVDVSTPCTSRGHIWAEGMCCSKADFVVKAPCWGEEARIPFAVPTQVTGLGTNFLTSLYHHFLNSEIS